MSPASQAEDAARAYSEWQQAVAGVLAKSRRVDAAELGPEPQKLLDTTTYDGVTVSPLYSVATSFRGTAARSVPVRPWRRREP